MIRSESNIHAFTDKAMNQALFAGQTWTQVCRNIVNTLPDQVYLSVDIDGLDPSLCPNTGTPVPGGLSMAQFLFLLDAVVESGRKFIGADLVEVSPGNDAWDTNVGARVLYAISHRLSE
jgi:agmatinase